MQSRPAVLALIPARAHSKRVKRKNMRALAGKPLIQYSIEFAMQSQLVADVVVSSDDPEVLQLAGFLNCSTIERPGKLATDQSPTIDAVMHALTVLGEKDSGYDAVALLQPTVPIRRIGLLEEAIRVLVESEADSVVSHLEVDYFHPNKMKRIQNGLIVDYCEKELPVSSRRDLPKAYYRDGSLYLATTESIKNNRSLIGPRTVPVMNDLRDFVNIDTERDWKLAEILLSGMQTEKSATCT